MPASPVLVYGASGIRGLPIVRQLLAKGATVRALAASEQDAQALQALGAETVLGTLDDPASLQRTSRGMDAVFLQLPINSGVQHGKNAIDAARQVGVRHLVFTTNAPVPGTTTDVPAIELMREVQAYLRSSGLPAVVLRPMFYMENFAGPWTAPGIAGDGTVAYPVPRDVRLPWISVEDAARLAVLALDRPDLAGSTFDIGGPDHLDADGIEAHFSRGLGRPVRYQATPLDDFEAQLNAALGAPAGTEVTKIYRWLAAHPDAGRAVDMSAVGAQLPVPLMPLHTWVARLKDTLLLPPRRSGRHDPLSNVKPCGHRL